jgi:UDP-sulfoquinovose synthase
VKVMILGGDGFCGWPTSLRLAKNGHSVVIVDNLSRRKIDNELSSGSLTDIATISERVRVANDLVGDIKFEFMDVAEDPVGLRQLLQKYRPDAVV